MSSRIGPYRVWLSLIVKVSKMEKIEACQHCCRRGRFPRIPLDSDQDCRRRRQRSPAATAFGNGAGQRNVITPYGCHASIRASRALAGAAFDHLHANPTASIPVGFAAAMA